VLDECYVGLNEARRGRVVAQAGTRVESSDEFERLLHGLDGTADGLGHYLLLLELQGTQVLVDHRQRVGKDLRRAMAVLLQFVVLLDIA